MKGAQTFEAELDIIGVNPYVSVPPEILETLFQASGKRTGPIPVCGQLNGSAYIQTLVKFSGAWRLYINTMMLPRSPKRIGELLKLSIAYDPRPRNVTMPEAFRLALEQDKTAKEVFEGLTASRKLEIVRYLAGLKSEAALERNVFRAIGFLKGQERFVGRDKP